MNFTIENGRVIFPDGSSRPATYIEQQLWVALKSNVPMRVFSREEVEGAALIAIGLPDTLYPPPVEGTEAVQQALRAVGFTGQLLFLPLVDGKPAITPFSSRDVVQTIREALQVVSAEEGQALKEILRPDEPRVQLSRTA